MISTDRMFRVLVAVLALLVTAANAWAALGIATTASGDQGRASTSVATSSFSTASANQLLLAFVSADRVSGSNTTVTGVSGGGLAWTLVRRTNVQLGTAEIWRAFAPNALANVTVTAALSQAVASSITVMTFTGVDTSGTNGSGAIGATASGNASSGAPTASLITTRPGSWVIGVGNDYDNPIARTLGPNQTLVHQYFPPVGDTYWVQRQTNPTAASGATVTINDTAPTGDRYNLTLVEVLPPGVVGSTYTIRGSVTPAPSGSGTTITLSQNGNTLATATADATGAYSFTGRSNGTYTLTPNKTGFAFTPASETVTVNGTDATAGTFTATAVPPSLLLPDLRVIVPTDRFSVVQTASGKMFQYTHDTFNAGPGPLIIQPQYNAASGTYDGTQYLYTLSPSGVWSIAQTVPIAGEFFWHAVHGHFHFPLVSFGLYQVAPDGSPGAAVVISPKVGFCIADSFIYDPSLPNAGAFSNLIGSCSDPTSLRGLSIGAVDEYDQSDPGQSIPIDGVADGTYWFRAIADPQNFLTEADKTNNETDVLVKITGTTVQVLGTSQPVLNPPPAIALTAPANASTVSGTVSITATTTTSGVKFLIDGRDFPGNSVATAPYTINWDSTTVADGTHWIAAQTIDSTGVVGTSPVAIVTVFNGTVTRPIVQLMAPATGSTLSGTVTLYATVASSLSIASVSFYVDNSRVGTITTGAPYQFAWNSTSVADGAHTFYATATDSLGNIGTSVTVTASIDNSHPPKPIGKDATAFVDGSDTMTTPAFSTVTSGDLLVAFVSYDGPLGSAQTASVSGAGLTWTLLARSNTQGGTSEIWSARASGTLTRQTVTAQPGNTGYHGSLTVIAFTNAAGTSVVGRAGGQSGAPSIYLPGVIAGDWVFAVGNDWDRAIARVPVAGQVLVHQRVDTQVGDTFWVQSTTVPSQANGLVTVADTSPTTDQWNFASVEIVAARQ
jgi:hypothetical protein